MHSVLSFTQGCACLMQDGVEFRQLLEGFIALDLWCYRASLSKLFEPGLRSRQALLRLFCLLFKEIELTRWAMHRRVLLDIRFCKYPKDLCGLLWIVPRIRHIDDVRFAERLDSQMLPNAINRSGS